jgi:Spy/CpxP family protein refolding chaperone
MTRTTPSSFNAFRLFGVALTVAVLSTAALSVWAYGGPGGPGGYGMHGGAGMMHDGQGIGMMQGRMGERMLDSVNATPEQRTQIKQIIDRNVGDRQAQRAAHMALRDQARQLFAQPTVDAAAAEQLRQQMLQQHDQASRRMMLSMVEISRILTPEQRKQMADRMAQRGEMMRRHMQERQQLQGAPATK